MISPSSMPPSSSPPPPSFASFANTPRNFPVGSNPMRALPCTSPPLSFIQATRSDPSYETLASSSSSSAVAFVFVVVVVEPSFSHSAGSVVGAPSDPATRVPPPPPHIAFVVIGRRCRILVARSRRVGRRSFRLRHRRPPEGRQSQSRHGGCVESVCVESVFESVFVVVVVVPSSSSRRGGGPPPPLSPVIIRRGDAGGGGGGSGRLVLILAGSLFYGTVSFRKFTSV
jgi:hypothetical protein